MYIIYNDTTDIFFYIYISKAFDITTHQHSTNNANWPKPHAMKELVPQPYKQCQLLVSAWTFYLFFIKAWVIHDDTRLKQNMSCLLVNSFLWHWKTKLTMKFPVPFERINRSPSHVLLQHLAPLLTSQILHQWIFVTMISHLFAK